MLPLGKRNNPGKCPFVAQQKIREEPLTDNELAGLTFRKQTAGAVFQGD